MKSNQIDMTTGPIFSKLLAFSIPLILSSILQLLFNAADIIVVGRFSGDNSLAAVGSTSSLINLLTNLFLGLSIGTNVVSAHFFGAKDKKKLQQTVHTAVLLSIYSGIILSIIGVFGAKNILLLMRAPKEVLDLATVYLKIYFSGVTATMIYNFGSALLRSKGDTQRPLVILFLCGIINVILNMIFVVKFKMDVKGVAFATVISQMIAAILVIVLLVKEEDDFKLNLKKLRIDRDIFINILKIGVPAGVQGILFSFSNVIIQSSVNLFGNTVIAGNSAAMNIEGFVYISMNSLSHGTLTFCSQNLGAGNNDRVKKVVFISQASVFAIGLILGGLAVVFSRPLLSIFSKSEDVVQAGINRLLVICSTYALCGMMDCMANTIRGIGNSVLPMIVTLLGSCALRILWIFSVFKIPKFHTVSTIYFSYPISWLVTWVALLACFFWEFKKICRVK